MTLRPYGVVLDGRLELGLEVVIENDIVTEIRPHTGIPELYVLSPAFVNAHSHLEYRGMMNKIDAPDYNNWIREITSLKKLQSREEVISDCLTAANENVATGVAMILEHSDRPFAGAAMRSAGLEGVIFQEVVTFNEHESPEEKIKLVEMNAKRQDFPKVFLNPHAYHTVDRATLSNLAKRNTPLSIHAAETPSENLFTREGTGSIADFYRVNNVPFEPTGKSVLASLDDLGLVRENTQLVHCCALTLDDIEIIKMRKASVAHCPRSNIRLQCPPAPIRELLDARIPVGLGLDSAASSGPIDMFAEMRAGLRTSIERGRPLTAEEIWGMATMPSPLMLGHPTKIEKGSKPRLIKIHVRDAGETGDIVERAHPGLVEWV